MKVCPVESSSKGNMYLVSHGEEYIILEAGIAGSKMLNYCKELTPDFTRLQGVFITHEHADHCSGLRVFGEHYLKASGQEKMSAYTSGKTCSSIATKDGKADPFLNVIEVGKPVTLGSFTVTAFPLPHKGDKGPCDCFAYKVTAEGETMCLCLDFGHIPDGLVDFMSSATLVILEANHDQQALRISDYPKPLKDRVAGKYGHLSNTDSATLVKQLLPYQLKTLIFAHMSETNNSEAYVNKTLAKVLEDTPPPELFCFAPAYGPESWYEVATVEEIPLN